MNEINLLDFFKTGTFGHVNLGMSRAQVLKHLGKPDKILPGMFGVSDDDYDTADIWKYGGVEINFISSDTINKENVQEIYFNPDYLWPPKIYLPKTDSFRNGKWKTKINKWIFEGNITPTKTQLILELSNESIKFIDTGLEMLVWNNEINNFQVITFQEELLKSSEWTMHDNECFGTLVLNSGVQVRYDEKDAILRVANGANWMYKGKESEIVKH